MPALIEFYEKNQDLKDTFEFISVHNESNLAKDFATLHQTMVERDISSKRWGGKLMTWPMMIDGDAKTAKAWGIFAYPTMAIIDPEGNLHSWGHHHIKAFAEIIDGVRKDREDVKEDADEAKPDAPSESK